MIETPKQRTPDGFNLAFALRDVFPPMSGWARRGEHAKFCIIAAAATAVLGLLPEIWCTVCSREGGVEWLHLSPRPDAPRGR